MSLQLPNGRITIYLSLVLALVLTIMPLPSVVSAWRPTWVLLVLLYWTLALPHRVNVGHAWVLGLLQDVLLGAPLGVHALSFSLACYVFALNFQRFRNFSIWQQSLLVGVICLLHQLLRFWAAYLFDDVALTSGILYPVFSSMVLWPWIFLLLRKTRRRFKVR
ncbi:rod shape-determining protein MreD [Corallincola spongiicola]|uniref:Rod shape-determining protein MreD n=1 Tax=Corallincola spongiicola TaxID=2520508 RepID=A0ABY1WNQ8_9GAMM|nr:rod shape-determining protein MreD [Corallincola spongiicola]TAA45184.1 rod shape-determining protein MreD [Corallincola spongiicola]